jgi:hypothetical protein
MSEQARWAVVLLCLGALSGSVMTACAFLLTWRLL